MFEPYGSGSFGHQFAANPAHKRTQVPAWNSFCTSGATSQSMLRSESQSRSRPDRLQPNDSAAYATLERHGTVIVPQSLASLASLWGDGEESNQRRVITWKRQLPASPLISSVAS